MKVAIHNNQVRVEGVKSVYGLPHTFNQTQQHMLRTGLEQDWDEAQFPSSVRAFLPQLMEFLVACASTEAQAGHLPGRLQMVDAIWTAEELFIQQHGRAFAVPAAWANNAQAALNAAEAARHGGEHARQMAEATGFAAICGIHLH